MRVLIIDDNLLLSFMLSEWFDFRGHIAEYETDPYEALKKVKSMNFEDYDYILLDLLLNGISGLDIFKVIKERGFADKVVVVSGCDKNTEIYQKAVAENLPIVVKNFKPEELVTSLEEGTIQEWLLGVS